MSKQERAAPTPKSKLPIPLPGYENFPTFSDAARDPGKHLEKYLDQSLGLTPESARKTGNHLLKELVCGELGRYSWGKI